MDSKQKKQGQRRKYIRPLLIKHENLKQVTAEWQCSVDTHKNQNGNGHRSHGNGYGYGHCKDK